jgi:lysophospholipase L1-like esterase
LGENERIGAAKPRRRALIRLFYVLASRHDARMSKGSITSVACAALAGMLVLSCGSGASPGRAESANGGNVSAAGNAGAAGAGAAEAGGGMGNGPSGPWQFPAGVTKPRIMIVGDSISAGPGCYKKHLLKNLTDNGYTSFEFVGEYNDDCGGGVKHSAVSCSTAEQYTQPTFTIPNCNSNEYQGFAPLAAKHTPDLVMLQLGVNDVWSQRPVETILTSYSKLVEQARAQNPNVVLVVAQIQKIRPDCSESETITKHAEALVSAVPAWAAKETKPESPVFVADLWTNSDWAKTDTNDCVHPNDVGAKRMGLNWYEALKGILRPN